MNEVTYINADEFELKEIKPEYDFKTQSNIYKDKGISFDIKGTFDIDSVMFRFIMKPPIVDIDIPDTLWMRYKKCEKCGNYVLHEPIFITKFIGGRGRSSIDKMAWDYTLAKMQRECENFPLWHCQACSNKEHIDILELIFGGKLDYCCCKV